MTESWRDVADFPGVQVSNLGRVRRALTAKRYPGRVHKLRTNWRGYEYALIHRGPQRTPLTVHSEVLKAFVGPRPHGYDASHINGSRRDNRAENLMWESRSANILRKRQHGTMVQGEAHKCAKLTAAAVIEMRAKRAAGAKLSDLSADYGVSEARISLIVRGEAWKHLLQEGVSRV